MTLVLTLTNGGGAAGTAKTFDRRGGTIGRNPDNDWVLSDPNRIVGRQHCRIDFDGVAYLLTDLSTNGVFMNGADTPLGRDKQIILQDGDRLTIGDFEIRASVRHGAAAPAARPGPAATDAGDPFGLNDFPDHVAPAQRVSFDGKKDDAFEDAFDGWGDAPEGSSLFDSPSATPPAPHRAPAATQADHHPIEMDALNLPPISGRASDFGPDDFGAATVGGPSLDDLDALLESLHEETQGGTAAEPPPFAAPSRAPPPPYASPPALPDDDDPFGLGADPAPPSPARSAPPPVPVAPLAPAEPPPIARPVAPRPPPAVAPVPSAADVDVVQALLQGLGLDPRALGNMTPAQFAHRAGQTLRTLVEGLREVMTARAMARNEFRIKGTVIGSRQNNPLKLAPTPESTLRQLVGETEPGYMRPDAALNEAIEDLKAHQLAMLAGMQRAIASLLEKFEPEALKQQLDHQPMLASILPGARKASYWTTYEAVYRKLASEAAEDFNAVFGREFARAYEEQADRLRAENEAARRAGPPS